MKRIFIRNFGKKILRTRQEEWKGETMEITSTVVWLILVIAFLLIELATVGLASIWFVGGSLAGMCLSMLGVHIAWQIVGALAVTIILLIFTRPFVMKYVNKNKEKTNYDGVIGQVICIDETVDNLAQTGSALVSGQVWTVRSADDSVLVSGEKAVVVEISGVKLMVKQHKEEV